MIGKKRKTYTLPEAVERLENKKLRLTHYAFILGETKKVIDKIKEHDLTRYPLEDISRTDRRTGKLGYHVTLSKPVEEEWWNGKLLDHVELDKVDEFDVDYINLDILKNGIIRSIDLGPINQEIAEIDNQIENLKNAIKLEA